MEQLEQNPFIDLEDKLNPEIPTVTREIYEQIALELGRKESGTAIRASAASMCPKRRWYQNHGYEGKPLTPRKIVNFLLGDLSEYVIQYFIGKACVGPGKFYSEVSFGEEIGELVVQHKPIKMYKQKEVITRFGDLEIPGHADGWGKRNSDGKWELIECKSASDYGFKSFIEDGPKDYLKQCHTLMHSDEGKRLDVKETRFFYIRKMTGNIYDKVVQFDSEILNQTRDEFFTSIQDEEPEDPFNLEPEMIGRGKNKLPTGNMKAVFPCSYCSFLEECKGEFVTEFRKSQGGTMAPTYIFKGE